MRWAYSPMDCQAHLLVPAGDLPWGVLTTRCGRLLPPGDLRQQQRPPGGAHRTCPTCAVIAQRPTTIPADRWVSPPQGGPSVPPAGHPNTTRAMWARCRVDGRLHLLSARAVLELSAMGCAVAWCATLLVTGELAVRGVGTPCPTCLAAGSAS